VGSKAQFAFLRILPLEGIITGHVDTLRDARLKSRFRRYDLRHTFGSRSAMAGVDLATLKELMGHSNISITMRYVHPTPEHKQEAVRKLERFNVEQVFAMQEKQSGSPQKSPQSEMHQNGATEEVLVN
jgi:integrase